ncbi:glycosyltransferase family 61 protein, partial [Neoroseomonas rubea]|uniref:glycosyltransferase family 61 protein n=1 Tax=Neoroseomonas rubea TaxID=2748666 RepID=UPI0018E057E0
ASAQPALRLAARALGRRLAGAPVEVRSHPAPHAYPAGPTGARPGASRTEIVAAPGLRPETRAAFEAQAERFEATLGARRPPPEVRAFHDVFVNGLGQVWQEGGQLLRGGEQAFPEASRAAMGSAPRIEEAVFAVERFNNIFHWTADVLPSIGWRFAGGVPDLPVLLRADAAPFKTESLAILAGRTAPAVLVGDAVRVRRLYFGAFGAGTISPEGPHRALIEAVAAAAAAAPDPADGLAERLYISRRDAAKRAMGNEAALETALAARGFGIRRFSGRGFVEQVRLIRGARAIVAPHGAALGLLLFARPGTAVFEIVPAAANAVGLRCCMARLSRLVALRHRMWLEPVNPITGAWAASLDPLLGELDAWLEDLR